ncbi:hypothetical protein BV898_03670 [Hypsibius exemplaris]|uniref:Uncharacterized protein n=1 Tax=Hypsibius exemplaris TaxID=2072580 RepID=A0A1W0X4R0_HYPEX|nr:hypothetical protein BV898_03670 [Hypsibius exemplaris]
MHPADNICPSVSPSSSGRPSSSHGTRRRRTDGRPTEEWDGRTAHEGDGRTDGPRRRRTDGRPTEERNGRTAHEGDGWTDAPPEETDGRTDGRPTEERDGRSTHGGDGWTDGSRRRRMDGRPTKETDERPTYITRTPRPQNPSSVDTTHPHIHHHHLRQGTFRSGDRARIPRRQGSFFGDWADMTGASLNLLSVSRSFFSPLVDPSQSEPNKLDPRRKNVFLVYKKRLGLKESSLHSVELSSTLPFAFSFPAGSSSLSLFPLPLPLLLLRRL